MTKSSAFAAADLNVACATCQGCWRVSMTKMEPFDGGFEKAASWKGSNVNGTHVTSHLVTMIRKQTLKICALCRKERAENCFILLFFFKFHFFTL